MVVSVLVWFFVPEPSQRNSAESDEMYAKSIQAWRMRKYESDVQRLQQHNLTMLAEK